VSSQAQRIATTLAAQPKHDVRAWLQQLAAALASEASLEPDTVADLVARGRPRWGVSSADDAAAYVDFWATLSARHDAPALRGAFADVLYLLGPKPRVREALDVFLAAARRDPEVFIAYAGDFTDLAADLGATKELDLVKIRFYAHRVDQGQMDLSELQDAVREMLEAYPHDTALRDELRAIALRPTSG
jgi:hypothetical protein